MLRHYDSFTLMDPLVPDSSGLPVRPCRADRAEAYPKNGDEGKRFRLESAAARAPSCLRARFHSRMSLSPPIRIAFSNSAIRLFEPWIPRPFRWAQLAFIPSRIELTGGRPRAWSRRCSPTQADWST